MHIILVGYFVTLTIHTALANYGAFARDSRLQPSALELLTHPFVKKFLEIRRKNEMRSMVGKGQDRAYTQEKYDAPSAQGPDFTDPFYKTQDGINLKKSFVDSLQTIYKGNTAGASQTLDDPFYRKSSGSNTAGIYDNSFNNYEQFRYRQPRQPGDLPIPDVLPRNLHRVNDPFQGPLDKLPEMLPASLRRFLDPYGRVGGIKKKGILEKSLQNVVDPYRNNAGGIRIKDLRDMYLPGSSDPFYKSSGGFRSASTSGNSQGFVDPFFGSSGGRMRQPVGNIGGGHGGNNMLPGITYVGADSQSSDVNYNPVERSWNEWLGGSSFEGNDGTFNVEDPLSWYRQSNENVYYPEDVQKPSPSVNEQISAEVPAVVEPVKVVKKVQPKVKVVKTKVVEKVKPAKVLKTVKKNYS